MRLTCLLLPPLRPLSNSLSRWERVGVRAAPSYKRGSWIPACAGMTGVIQRSPLGEEPALSWSKGWDGGTGAMTVAHGKTEGGA